MLAIIIGFEYHIEVSRSDAELRPRMGAVSSSLATRREEHIAGDSDVPTPLHGRATIYDATTIAPPSYAPPSLPGIIVDISRAYALARNMTATTIVITDI